MLKGKVIPKLKKLQGAEKVFHGSGNVFKDLGLKHPSKLLKLAEEYDKEKPDMKFSKWLDSLSLCPHCYCMTYTIKGKCGKCKKEKEKQK
jgi:hypothetical protein